MKPSLSLLSSALIGRIAHILALDVATVRESGCTVTVNEGSDAARGDLACNAAMVLARHVRKAPRMIAEQIVEGLTGRIINAPEEPVHPVCPESKVPSNPLLWITSASIAGPGFINITLDPLFWNSIACQISESAEDFFTKEHINGSLSLQELFEGTPQTEATVPFSFDTKIKIKTAPQPVQKKSSSYLIEFVSANPTGPLHLGHGRNAIIGDVLKRVLTFCGNDVKTEFYINDAGSQMAKLGNSLRIRCMQALGDEIVMPEDGYHGTYLQDIAQTCIEKYGEIVREKDVDFFTDIAHEYLLATQKKDLAHYGVTFNEWFSEKTLHESGAITKVLERLEENGMLYEKDGAQWFAATKFGDDKDRVIRKEDGSLTYIAADIAYHAGKFKRGSDVLVDILGQDHHGYVKRLKGTMEALGYDSEALKVILYQLVSLKKGNEMVKMSKRAGTFITLTDVINTVGVDAARFYFLNKKAEAHLELDIDMALKKNNENPVFYLQYAYVRTSSILAKAVEKGLTPPDLTSYKYLAFAPSEIAVLKKMLGLSLTLSSIEQSFATHLLAFYALDMAQSFHSFYTNNRVIDEQDIATTQRRLALVKAVQNIIGLTHDLLGLTKLEEM